MHLLHAVIEMRRRARESTSYTLAKQGEVPQRTWHDFIKRDDYEPGRPMIDKMAKQLGVDIRGFDVETGEEL